MKLKRVLLFYGLLRNKDIKICFNFVAKIFGSEIFKVKYI